jgi:hypothetical protein
MQTATINNVFIQAPITEVQRAWNAYLTQESLSPDDSNIHLVPAQGGCFLVTTFARSNGSLFIPWISHLSSRDSKPLGQSDLTKFQRDFEKGRWR